MKKYLYRFLQQWVNKKLEEEKQDLTKSIGQETQPEYLQNIQQEEAQEEKAIKSPPEKKFNKQLTKQKTDYEIITEKEIEAKKPRRKKLREGELIIPDRRDIRDVMELMGFPLVSIYKKKNNPSNL